MSDLLAPQSVWADMQLSRYCGIFFLCGLRTSNWQREVVMRVLAVAAFVFACASGTCASAWWDMGHMQIAAVAYQGLDSAVRAKVDSLIELNPNYAIWIAGLPADQRAEAAFVHAATWPDDIKTDPAYHRDGVGDATAAQNIGYADHIVHDYWHYIDIPFSTDGTSVRPPDSPNALTQIRLFASTLSSGASDDVKSYDLVWLLHLVGDVHQPLHATARFSKSLDDDRGGNDESVTPVGGATIKLHAFWDGVLGDRGTPATAIAAAHQLPAPDPARSLISDPALWLIESFATAQNQVYTAAIADGEGPFPLDQSYLDHALIVAKQRAAVAGVRLANLINDALK